MKCYKPLSDYEYSMSADLQGLDIAKFVCAILVLSIHISPFENSYWRQPLALVSNLCVPFFFLCSAWLVFRNIDITDLSSIRNKIKKTIIRMLGIYLLWTAIYLPVAIKDIITLDFEVNRIFIVIRNLIFSGSYNHLWYLIGAVWGLGIIYFLLKCHITPKGIFLISIPVFLFGLCCSSYFSLFPYMHGVSAPYLRWFNSVRNGLFVGFPFMSLGLLLTTNRKSFKKIYVWILLALFCVIYACEYAVIKYFDWDQGMNLLLSMLPLVGLLFYVVVHVKVRMKTSVSIFFREQSIIIYLVHIYFGMLAGLLTDHALLQFTYTLCFSIAFGTLLILLRKNTQIRLLKYLY